MRCVFIQIRCKPGQAYTVADTIYDKEIVSELYSTSGEFDLLAKLYVSEDVDIGRYLNNTFHSIDGVERTLTTMTFKAF